MKALFFLLILITLALQAVARPPLRDPHMLTATTEQVLPVTTARVIYADYDLIRQDFAEVQGLTNDEIDAWLVRNGAFVSIPQTKQTEVNSPISTGTESRLAYRPREYRRAHVFITEGGALIDAKGTGSVDPEGGSHANGLMTLGDAIREFLFEKLVSKVLKHAHSKYDTLGAYAVLDFGFDVKQDKSVDRAGIVLRQAHVRYFIPGERHKGSSSQLPRAQQKEIELTLRRYGITSTIIPYGPEYFEALNIQGSTDFSITDFGSFRVVQNFTRSVRYTLGRDGSSNKTWDDAIFVGSRDFVQPDPRIRVPFELWGWSQSGIEDSNKDNPYIWSHETAQGLKEGHAQRIHAEIHYHNMLDPVDQILNAPPACEDFFTPAASGVFSARPLQQLRRWFSK